MKEVIRIFKEIQNTSSLNDKKAIITANKDNELFKKCLVFLLDSNITSGISAKKYNKIDVTCSDWQHNNISEEFCKLLDYIQKNNTGRDDDVIQCKAWCYGLDDDIQEFTEGMVTKSIKLGADAKLVNKCIPGLIRTFDVMLGTPLEKIKLKGNEWISISQKLNGTRVCWCDGKFMTRQGKEYIGLDHIKEDILKVGFPNTFIDGELIYKNEEGLSDSEAFQIGCGIANSKSGDKSQLKMVVFDMIPKDEFWEGKSTKKYSERKKDLEVFKQILSDNNIKNLEVVTMLYEGNDHSKIMECLDYAEENDWEGCMVNLDAPYECKRVKTLCKLKRFFEIDLRCTSVNIADTGKYKDKLGSITCKFGDSTVDVGSGFSDEQRDYYTEHPEEIIGKIIAIRYKEMTTSKAGNKSLQFPTLLAIRDGSDKNVADDET